MAPKRGGKEILSTDPTFIYYVFNYVMLGLFGLCYLYAIKPLVQKKEHALFLHNVVGLITLGYLSAFLHGELDQPGNLYSSLVFNRIGFAFAWLFALEPSRRIMNLQSSNPNAEKISVFNIKQYLNSVLGCAILLCYVYVILYAIFNIVFVVLAFTVYFYSYVPIIQMNSYLELGSWPLFLIWVGLVWEHRSLLCHVRSLNFYGFLLFCGLIGRTVYVATLDTWNDPVGNIVFNFILYDVSLFFAVCTGLIYGPKWFDSSKFDLTPA